MLVKFDKKMNVWMCRSHRKRCTSLQRSDACHHHQHGQPGWYSAHAGTVDLGVILFSTAGIATLRKDELALLRPFLKGATHLGNIARRRKVEAVFDSSDLTCPVSLSVKHCQQGFYTNNRSSHEEDMGEF